MYLIIFSMPVSRLLRSLYSRVSSLDEQRPFQVAITPGSSTSAGVWTLFQSPVVHAFIVRPDAGIAPPFWLQLKSHHFETVADLVWEINLFTIAVRIWIRVANVIAWYLINMPLSHDWFTSTTCHVTLRSAYQRIACARSLTWPRCTSTTWPTYSSCWPIRRSQKGVTCATDRVCSSELSGCRSQVP